MNLPSAIDALNKGNKVKLPEWTGYWFIPEELLTTTRKVHAFTKEGDVLDTPWFDKYSNRTDFEITAGKLGFDFALLAIFHNKKVHSPGWGGEADKKAYITFFKESHPLHPTGPCVVIFNDPENMEPHLWLPDYLDLLRTDYEVIS